MDHHRQLQHQNSMGQQPQHAYAPQQAQMMAGSPQIGSPMMNQNSYMQQQHQMQMQQQQMMQQMQVHSNQGHQFVPQQHQQMPNPMQYAQQPQHQSYQHQQQQPQMQYAQQMQQQQYPQQQQYGQQMQQQQQQYPPSPGSHHRGSINSGTSGPRAKCDQVVYEALAKACEVAVRGRCADEGVGIGGGPDSINARGYSDGVVGIGGTNRTEKRRSWNYGGGQNASGAGGGTSGRFNIEVDEVPSVRQTVSPWKRAPHVPLRLDIYYEHDACYDRQNEILGGERQRQTSPQPQRELLERWCVDYVPSASYSLNSSLSSSPSSTSPFSSRIMTGATVSNDKSTSNISQLRQVCKRIVVMLRSLHCMTRMLPAHGLKCLLESHATSDVSGGGMVAVPGAGMVNAGAVHGHAMGGGVDNGVGWGTIGYSIHASEYEHEPALPSPSFARQSLPSVSTPYGSLCCSVMYDATLNPNHMVADLAERRAEFIRQYWSGGGQQQQLELQQQMQMHYEQQIPIQADVVATSTQPIPIAQQVVPHSGGTPPAAAVVGSLPQRLRVGSREYKSCPPATIMGGPASLGAAAAGRSRAVSDFIISDYHHSPKLGARSANAAPGRMLLSSPADVNLTTTDEDGAEGGKQRVLSGLSLAMMNEDDNTSPVEHAPNPSPNLQPMDEPVEVEETLMLPFGSPATRAAFHNPPPVYHNLPGDDQQLQDEPPPPPDQQQQQLSSSPSPLMSTPPTNQDAWPQNSSGGRKALSPGDARPPFVNPTMLQPPPSPSRSVTVTHSNRSGTPPTSVLGGRHSPLIGSLNQQHRQSVDEVQNGGQRGSFRRASSSSVHLLPPVTSLDVLQKSPFVVSRKTAPPGKGGKNQTSENDLLANMASLNLGTNPSLENEGVLSSIPRMVSNDNDRSGSIAVSTLGGGSSTNPLAQSGAASIVGGYCSTGPYAANSAHRSAGIMPTQTASTSEADELPFAVDDETVPPAGSSSPSKSRSLWGSTRADVLEGTLGGGVGGAMADVASSLAVSSLHHRCAADGRVRLRMFDGGKAVESATGLDLTEARSNGGGGAGDNDVTNGTEFTSIEDKLSDFRSFGASLMVGSSHDESARVAL